MRYSIEFEPSDTTNAIRILHLSAERDHPEIRLRAYWSNPENGRRIGARVECHVSQLLGYWRHLRCYVRRPRCRWNGTLLPCVYHLPVIRNHELLGYFNRDEFREIANHVDSKRFRLEVDPDDVTLFLSHVADLYLFATGFPPRF